MFTPKKKKSKREDSLFLEHTYVMPLGKRILIRTIVVTFLTSISIFVFFLKLKMKIPYFLLMIGFVTSISVVCDVYLFPVLFRWKIDPPKTILSGLVLTVIFLVGITGSITGLYSSVNGIVGKLKGNPFDNMFEFTCF